MKQLHLNKFEKDLICKLYEKDHYQMNDNELKILQSLISRDIVTVEIKNNQYHYQLNTLFDFLAN